VNRQWNATAAPLPARPGLIAALLAPCAAAVDGEGDLVARGRHLFFNETFAGNGRTCGTCHPAENNFTLDAAYIARLPASHPLFVAEFQPALKQGFESPRLMREFGLIRENLDGFDDLDNRFVMRSVPHVLAMATSVQSPGGPRTGWSGDGAPGDGSLRAICHGGGDPALHPLTAAGSGGRLPPAQRRGTGRPGSLHAVFGTPAGTRPAPGRSRARRPGAARRSISTTAWASATCAMPTAAPTPISAPAAWATSASTPGWENLPETPARLSGEHIPATTASARPAMASSIRRPW